MKSRTLVVIALATLTPYPVAAQDEAPRTSWGDPDLQGVWDYRTITPLQRPMDLADQVFLTEEEAARRNEAAVDRETRLAAQEARRTKEDPSGNVDRGVDGAPGSYNHFWFDRGTSVIATNRTSLIIDPPNGRIPSLTTTESSREFVQKFRITSRHGAAGWRILVRMVSRHVASLDSTQVHQ